MENCVKQILSGITLQSDTEVTQHPANPSPMQTNEKLSIYLNEVSAKF